MKISLTGNKPFDYKVLDNFLSPVLANKLSQEFPPYDSDVWYEYNQPYQKKKSCNIWWNFPPDTYKTFTYLNSPSFIKDLSHITGIRDLYPDMGLHGGGWHIHSTGGVLNYHLDYKKHPKLNLKRVINLIIYLTPEWDSTWGGNLHLSSGNEKEPDYKTVQVIENKFNRAVIFNCSQNSWHGFPEPLTCPEGVYRKSIAVYYLTHLDGTEDTTKAMFKEQ